MRRGFWVGLLLLAGCGRAGLRAVEVGEVELSSDALHFSRTFVGFPTRVPLTLHNRSRVDRRLTLAGVAPFSSAVEARVPGGSELQVEVTFAPVEAGNANGVLSLSDGESSFEVKLDGEGVAPLSCSPPALCRLSAFDPSSGTCVESTAPEGSGCSSILACAVGGVCSNGECLGSSPDCSDNDRCTLDSCAAGGGCMHQPKSCAAPTDPCKVASCDPTLGCVEHDAVDGTACGPADCETASVCIVGKCKALPVPEGASCGATTACQEKGVCRQHRCELAAPGPLKEAWNHPFSGEFNFRGVTDASQNLYWLECSADLDADCAQCLRCVAVSVTRDGVERFRTDVGPLPGGATLMTHLLANGRLVYAANGSLGSISATTGAKQWSYPLATQLHAAPDLANVEYVDSIAADSAGQVYFLVRRYQATPNAAWPRQAALLKVDSSTGALAFARFFDGDLTTAVVDEHDHLFFGLYPRTSGAVHPEVRSLEAAGAQRWRLISTTGDTLNPLSVFNGQLLLGGGRVVSTLDGSTMFSAPPEGQMRNALMSVSGRTLLQPPAWYPEGPKVGPSVRVVALPAGSATASWEARVAEGPYGRQFALISDQVAAATGDVLIAGVQPQGGTQLTGLTSTGATRFVCEVAGPLPDVTLRFDSVVALLDGRWAVVERSQCNVCDGGELRRLRVFEVPGEAPATHGWVGSFGGPSGDSRPLP